MAIPKAKAKPPIPVSPNQDRLKYARAFTASAERLTLSSARTQALLAKRQKMWQEEAWRFYDEIGEIWFAHNFIGNAVRRVRLYAAEIVDPDQPPVPLVAGESELATRAINEVARLNNANGGIPELLFDLAMNLSAVGDCTLVGWTAPSNEGVATEHWQVCSLDALQVKDKNAYIHESPEDREGMQLPDDAFTLRVWCSHPRWHGLADSSMKGILESCDELQILSRQIRASGKSRLSAGIFFVPSEADFGPLDNTEDETDGNARSSKFIKDLLDHMTTPISDDGSASAVVPMVVELAADLIEKIRLVTFDRPLDAVAVDQRNELIRRIAQGIDLPPEILLGMADANHWTGWLIDDTTFVAHIENKVLAIVNALTTGFLLPALGDTEGRNIVVWYDPADAVSNPNQLQDAKELHERLVLSDATLRRIANFNDDDAPDDEELQRRLALKTAMTPDIAIELLKAVGVLPLDFEITSVTSEPETVIEPVAEDEAPVDETQQPPAEDEAEVLLAAGAKRSKKIDRLGNRLFMIDRDTRISLATAADGAVLRSLEMAGARVRRRVGNDKALSAKLAGVQNTHVCMALGRETVAKFATEDELLVDGLKSLQARYDMLTTRAQARVKQIALEYGYDDEDLIDQRQEDDRDAGWLILLAGLALISRTQLFGPGSEVPEFGEFDDATLVPANVVRESLARAGGARLDGSTKITTSVRGQAKAIPDAKGLLLGVDQKPAGGIATGEYANDLFEEVGLRVSDYLWVYGDASSRKSQFEPHQELDGEEFDSWTSSTLQADSSEFPYVSFYYPGDHLYCQCDFAPNIEEI